MKRPPLQSAPAPAGAPGNPAFSGAGSPALASLTDRLAALTELVRLRILRILEHEELTVGEVAKVVQLPQSTVSRHLKLLADAAWLERRAEGTAGFYRLLLDDLPAEARALWVAVRAQLDADGAAQVRADLQRLGAVLADRRTDSLTYFGRVAGEWDAIRAELFGRGFTATALLGLLSPEWVVADLGCGTGNAAEHLAPFVKRVVAVDQSAPMLKAAKKRLREFGNVEFARGDLLALPLEDESVDATTCALVLHHLDDLGAAIGEMRRVLKPGGVALIVDMQAHERAIYRSAMGHRHLGFGEERMLALLRDGGLTGARVVALPGDPDGKGPGLFVATARRPLDGQRKNRPGAAAPADADFN